MRLLESIDILSAARKLHGRTEFQGLKISIENRKGSIREGIDKDGKPWKTKFKYPYGYIRLTRDLGADGEHVDCFIGPNKECKNAYIIHQKDPWTGKYDEDKCMLGWDSRVSARLAYEEHYNRPGFYGAMTVMPMEKFKNRVLNAKRRGKIAASLFTLIPIPTDNPPGDDTRIPVDEPDEIDDKFLDVTNRNSTETKKARMEKISRKSIGSKNVQRGELP